MPHHVVQRPNRIGLPYRGPGATRGVLDTLLEFDDNNTIHVTVDSVLIVGPLHDAGHYAALPVASNDPAVLGPLDDFRDNELFEFRAWHPGHADLFVAPRACNRRSNGGPCASQWIVHVIVT
jgi:hypothetical protein